VDAAHPCGVGAWSRGIEMRHLRARVHAAVGAAGGSHADRLAGDRSEGRFENVLYRAAARLGLPAEKAAAVVLESYGNAWNKGLAEAAWPSLARSCSALPRCAASPSFITSLSS